MSQEITVDSHWERGYGGRRRSARLASQYSRRWACERNVANVRELRVSLELQLLSVHAGRLRMSYRRAVQMEHTERLKVWKLASKFVLFPPTLHQRRW